MDDRISKTDRFTSLDLPSLSTVKNYVNVQSASDLDCTSINALQAGGSITCEDNLTSPQPFIAINETVAFPVDPDAPTSTGINAATTIAASPPDTISHSGGLSTGAKAGIAIGVILGTCLLAVFIFMCARKRRMRRKALGSFPETGRTARNFREYRKSHYRRETKDRMVPAKHSHTRYEPQLYEASDQTRSYELDAGGKG